VLLPALRELATRSLATTLQAWGTPPSAPWPWCSGNACGRSICRVLGLRIWTRR